MGPEKAISDVAYSLLNVSSITYLLGNSNIYEDATPDDVSGKYIVYKVARFSRYRNSNARETAGEGILYIQIGAVDTTFSGLGTLLDAVVDAMAATEEYDDYRIRFSQADTDNQTEFDGKLVPGALLAYRVMAGRK